MEMIEKYEKIFKALSDRNRLKILENLLEGEMNAGQILDTLNIVQSTLSHHMKMLCESGLVNARRSGKWTCYELNPDTAAEAAVYLKVFAGNTKDGEAVETDMPGMDTSAAAEPVKEEPAGEEPAAEPAAERVEEPEEEQAVLKQHHVKAKEQPDMVDASANKDKSSKKEKSGHKSKDKKEKGKSKDKNGKNKKK